LRWVITKPQNKKCPIAGNPEKRINAKEIKRFGSTPKKIGAILYKSWSNSLKSVHFS
jgi:hypothetical protein